jgi:hypothetical protein
VKVHRFGHLVKAAVAWNTQCRNERCRRSGTADELNHELLIEANNEEIEMNISRKIAVGVAAGAIVAVALSACSSSTKSSSSSSSASDGVVKPVAQIDSLTGKSTSVALDAGFTGALTTLGLTPGVVGKATLAGTTISFPITGGNVTYYTPGTKTPYVSGDIKHAGSGLSLTAGATKVELTNFEIDPGTSHLYGDVSVNGASAATHAYLFYLDGTTLKPLVANSDGTATLQGTRVTVSGDAAKLLDATFKTEAVKAGLLVGVASIVVNTK